MAELLIYSLAEFADIIFPCPESADGRNIAEIGALERSIERYPQPLSQKPLLARLERNPLDCYLDVIEWQDRYDDEYK